MTTVTVVRHGGRDEHGDPLPGTEHTVDDCMIAPRRFVGVTSESDDRGEGLIVGLTLFAPFGADITAADQIRIAEAAWAGLYDVVGEPGQWESPFTGWQPGMEVALTRHG